jgi:hypothetical protein
MSRKGSASSRSLKQPICTLMLACDGNNLKGSRKDTGVCCACAEKQLQREKGAKARDAA